MDLVQRLLVLAAATLVAFVAALAVVEVRDRTSPHAAVRSVPAPGGGWYSALAGPYSLPRNERRTACGYPTRARTLQGVSHPVLPCGAKLALRIGHRVVLTQVVDRASARNREFGITHALARRLGLRTVERVRWRFASP